MPLMGRASWAFMLSCALALAAGGCAAAGPSLVEKGERVDTGRRQYDAYFEQVGELRDKVKGLDSDLFQLREKLVDAMDLGVDAKTPEILLAARNRVDELKSYGLLVTLELTPQPRILQAGEVDPGSEQQALVSAIEESARRGMEVYKERSELLDEIQRLDGQRADLAEKLDQLPPNFDKRGLIEDELVGAGRVLREAEKKLLDDTRNVSHFLVGLAEIANTGAGEQREQRCDTAIAAAPEPPPPSTKPKPSPKSQPKSQPKSAKGPRPQPRTPPRPQPPRPQPPVATAPPPPPVVPKPRPTRPAGGEFEM
jgi:hypothetical protein